MIITKPSVKNRKNNIKTRILIFKIMYYIKDGLTDVCKKQLFSELISNIQNDVKALFQV